MTVDILPLRDLATFFKGWSPSLCLTMHCIWGASQLKHLRSRFLLHFCVSYLCSFGGAMLSSLALMRPDSASLFLLSGNDEALMWIVSWWTVNYFPFDAVDRLIRMKPVWITICVGSAFCRANIIVSRVDLGAEFMPGNHIAPVILGTLASSGGKFVSELMLRIVSPSMPGPVEIEKPGFVFWSAVLCSQFYYTMSYFFKLFDPVDAWAIICATLTGHALLIQLTGMPLDFTVIPRQIIYGLRILPDPGKTVAAEETSTNGDQSKKNR